MSADITIQVNCRLPDLPTSQSPSQSPDQSPIQQTEQSPIRQINCPAGTQAGDVLALYGDQWQSKDVLMVSAGRVILPGDILHEGMTLDILPLVDGG